MTSYGFWHTRLKSISELSSVSPSVEVISLPLAPSILRWANVVVAEDNHDVMCCVRIGSSDDSRLRNLQ